MQLQDKAITAHVAQNTNGRRSAVDDRITRHPGYALSQRIRKRVEEAFGWAKTVAGLRKMRHRGLLKGRLAIHPRDGRLQPRPAAQIARRGCPMSRRTSDALLPPWSASNATCRKSPPAPAIPIAAKARAPKISIFSAPC
jgi:hypothetical protein